MSSIQEEAHAQEEEVDEKTTLLPVQTHVFKRRWYILFVFSLLSCTQNGLWSTWGPISASAEEAFDWTDADIALLSMWGPISYIITAFILSWIVDVRGLRWACLIMAFLVALGSGIRCITDQPPYVKWTINIGQFLNDLAGPCSAIPPLLSATWFPANQRVTATAISVTISNLGAALMDFILECAWSVFVFLLLLIYFPAKPPKPPTVSASIERDDFKSGVKNLVRNVKFWLICATYGVSVGVFSCWLSVLDVVLKPHGISQKDTGWLSFYAVLAGCVGSVILARTEQYILENMWHERGANKRPSACYPTRYPNLYSTAVVTFYPLSALEVSLYIAIIVATLLLNSAVPLYFEMACEVTYPVSEGITNFVLTLVKNAGGILFLGLLMVPSLGTDWENWAALGAIISCVPVLLLFKERFSRLDVDEVNR
ncbi:hypothetical protein FSP39_011798 [Pinctada imbricata]|uniref:Uncharacterized protein n=1 Tax=Pinctada imbricata TaxID=66713 RepID=A0AA89BZA2_PINIB|nr:hypothetical protein FSP39_011798 [Pinctada imbricata]